MKLSPPLRNGYKALSLILLLYAILAGFLLTLPAVPGLEQSSRSLFFHLPMWFAMYFMQLVSLIFSVRYLRKGRYTDDIWAKEAATLSIVFGVFGLVTGMIWSRVTWGQLLPDTDFSAWWLWDPKQTLALICVLIYIAYLVLRNSLDEVTRRAKLGAVFNVLAFASVFPLTYIVPRMLQSLHPGAENVETSFSAEYRMVLYPAALGFILLGCWLLELRYRRQRAEAELDAFTR
jgi:heme exporter protein C